MSNLSSLLINQWKIDKGPGVEHYLCLWLIYPSIAFIQSRKAIYHQIKLLMPWLIYPSILCHSGSSLPSSYNLLIKNLFWFAWLGNLYIQFIIFPDHGACFKNSFLMTDHYSQNKFNYFGVDISNRPIYYFISFQVSTVKLMIN